MASVSERDVERGRKLVDVVDAVEDSVDPEAFAAERVRRVEGDATAADPVHVDVERVAEEVATQVADAARGVAEHETSSARVVDLAAGLVAERAAREARDLLERSPAVESANVE